MKPRTDPTWEQLSAKLDLIARLLAYLVAAGHDNLEQRAVALNALGLSTAEIARVCNTTRNTISVRLAEAKKRPKSRQSKRVRKARRGGRPHG
jgi:DNA-directed RNA polymerase specialized sigma24 family protein